MKYMNLKVWQKSIDLVVAVYRETARFPREETYGLKAQMRRSAVSVPSNIAEGEGRASRKETHQFLNQARGSLMELETQIIIAERLGYFDGNRSQQLIGSVDEVSRMVTALMRYVKSRF